jgi:hypothetical protein
LRGRVRRGGRDVLPGDGAHGAKQIGSGYALEKPRMDKGQARGLKRKIGLVHSHKHKAARGFAGVREKRAGMALLEESLVEEDNVGSMLTEKAPDLPAGGRGGDEFHIFLVADDDAPGHAVELGGHGEQDAYGRGGEFAGGLLGRIGGMGEAGGWRE